MTAPIVNAWTRQPLTGNQLWYETPVSGDKIAQAKVEGQLWERVSV